MLVTTDSDDATRGCKTTTSTIQSYMLRRVVSDEKKSVLNNQGKKQRPPIQAVRTEHSNTGITAGYATKSSTQLVYCLYVGIDLTKSFF